MRFPLQSSEFLGGTSDIIKGAKKVDFNQNIQTGKKAEIHGGMSWRSQIIGFQIKKSKFNQFENFIGIHNPIQSSQR